jgi:3'-phosphoadenosine 5'-phosphosulfate sulfotransferase (PAPS reductase)/FAD synthetase
MAPTAIVLQEFFCPSSKGWPVFMRINPIINWTYGDVWAYLSSVGAKHCTLYDQGYTSLGSVNDTVPNSALLKPNGEYAPAHSLSGANVLLLLLGRRCTLHCSTHTFPWRLIQLLLISWDTAHSLPCQHPVSLASYRCCQALHPL